MSPNKRKSEYEWTDLIQQIGLIVPADRLAETKGIRIDACNGWIISNESYWPDYLNGIRTTDPMTLPETSTRRLVELGSEHKSKNSIIANIKISL